MGITDKQLSKIKVLYKEVKCFGNRLIFCKDNGMWNLYSDNEEISNKYKFSGIRYMKDINAVACKHEDGYTVIDCETTESILDVDKMFNIIEVDSKMHIYASLGPGLHGIVDKNGKIILPFMYELVKLFKDSEYIVGVRESYDTVVSREGKILFSKYCDSITPLKDGRLLVKINRDFRIESIDNNEIVGVAKVDWEKHEVLTVDGDIIGINYIINDLEGFM